MAKTNKASAVISLKTDVPVKKKELKSFLDDLVADQLASKKFPVKDGQAVIQEAKVRNITV